MEFRIFLCFWDLLGASSHGRITVRTWKGSCETHKKQFNNTTEPSPPYGGDLGPHPQTAHVHFLRVPDLSMHFCPLKMTKKDWKLKNAYQNCWTINKNYKKC